MVDRRDERSAALAIDRDGCGFADRDAQSSCRTSSWKVFGRKPTMSTVYGFNRPSRMDCRTSTATLSACIFSMICTR